MLARPFFLVLSYAWIASPLRGEDETDSLRSWPQWRGPLATGVAPLADPPTEWSQTKNVAWKTALPGAGHSTPIVWGERVFVTAAEPFGEAMPPKYDTAEGAHDGIPVTHRHRFLVMALDRRDGTIVWKKTVREEVPHEGGHVTGSYASASPATDGERIFAHFGSRGLYCLDFDGKIIWHVDLGRMSTKHAHGEASSPVVFGDTIAVNWDQEKGSFVVALDTRTGKERWRVARDEETSWSSPIVVERPPESSGGNGGKPQLVVSGTNRIRGYDLATGKVLWECGGLSSNVVASMSGCAGQRCMAASVMVAVANVEHIIARMIQHATSIVPGKDLGPVISEQSRERITKFIDEAVAQGASLLVDGRGVRVEGREGGYWMGPTILDHVKPDMRIAQEEVFGPVLVIIRAADVDEALRVENNSPYGNAASVFTESGGIARRVMERASAGMVGVNVGVPVPREPFSFGGWNDSKFGVGDITGRGSIEFWTQAKKMTTKWNREAGTNWMS